jgi:hypothetical protein
MDFKFFCLFSLLHRGFNSLVFYSLGLIISCTFLFSPSLAFAGEPKILTVGEFSQESLDGWVPKKFVETTLYSFIQVDGSAVLKAESQNSASGLIQKIRVDLKAYPFLNWRWRVEKPLTGSFDERQKSGDDYAARIYVVVSGGLAIWNTRALNYVWAANSSKGDVWPNAFAGKNAIMKALQSSESPLSVWQKEKRNIHEDFKNLFQREVRFIDAVVLMSDTDNTGKEATAYYGDIYFSAE